MAATGTPTPNIGLRRAQGTDPASVDDINYNSALIDTKLGAVGNSSVQDQIDTLNSNLANTVRKVNLMSLSSYTGKTLVDYVASTGEKIWMCSCTGGNKISDLPIVQAGNYIVYANITYPMIDFLGTNGSHYIYVYNDAWYKANAT